MHRSSAMRWIGYAAIGALAGVVTVFNSPGRSAPSRAEDAASAARAVRQEKQEGQEFRWRGTISPGEWLWLRNLNGEIQVERAEGAEVEVTATKRAKHSDPESVEIVTLTGEGGVTICALWEARDRSCEPGGHYHHSNTKKG